MSEKALNVTSHKDISSKFSDVEIFGGDVWVLISAVKVGLGSGAFSEGGYDSCNKSNTPSGIYTDAKSQHMLASTEDFVDTDKSPMWFNDLLESYAQL